jgi:hypothetical protein
VTKSAVHLDRTIFEQFDRCSSFDFPVVKRTSPGFGRAENVVGFLSLDFICRIFDM